MPPTDLIDSRHTRSEADRQQVDTAAKDSQGPDRRTRRWVLGALPLAAFGGLTGFLAWGLTREPGTVPSPLVGSRVPDFDLPPVQGRSLGLASQNLVGEVSLVNVFASWCVACRAEHPLFMRLAASGAVPLYGLNYRDQPEDAAEWLDTLGDPYTRTGADLDGRVAVDWGVTGVPETFVVGADGRIAHKHFGAVTAEVLNGTILPLVEELRREAGGAS